MAKKPEAPAKKPMNFVPVIKQAKRSPADREKARQAKQRKKAAKKTPRGAARAKRRAHLAQQREAA